MLRMITCLLVGCMIGCGQRPEHNNVATTRRDSARVEIVTNDRRAFDTTTMQWRVDAAPTTSIGGNESDPQQHFEFIFAARRLSDGRVVVATQSELRWFSASGAYLMTSSRAGDGPGEFRYLQTLYRRNGDTLVAADQAGQRVSTFGPDGAFIRESRLDWQRFRSLGRWAECESGLLPDGSRFACAPDSTIPPSATNRANRMVKPGWSSPGPGHLRQLQRTHIIPPSLDRTYRISIVAGIEQFGVPIGRNDATAFASHPFYSRSVLAAGGEPMRIVTMLNPDYRLEVWTPAGQLERVINMNGARRTPTPLERTAARDEVTRRLSRQVDPALLSNAVTQVEVPDSLPAAVDLAISSENEIVVTRDAWLPATTRTLVDVFSGRGAFIGWFQLPPSTRIFEVGSDYVLVARYDEHDVPHVEVYRLHRQ